MNDLTKVSVEPPNACMMCGKRADPVWMPKEACLRWRHGELLQVAWPSGSEADREVLISGTHSECYDALAESDD